MNNRLEYKNYRGNKDILTIDLHNGYTVIVIITLCETNTYDIQLMLKENTIEKWESIEEAEHIMLFANARTINSAILKRVATLYKEGFFNHYIDRFEYELKCFDIGYELYEKKKG